MTSYANIICILSLLLCAPTDVNGQAEPFETLTIGLYVSQDISSELFHTFWRPSKSIALAVQAPFYLGTIQVEARPTIFGSIDQNQKDFIGAFALLRWNIYFGITNSISWYGGVTVGNLFMRFQDEVNPSESEVVMGYQTGFSWQLNSRMGVCAQYSHEQLRTYYPINFKYQSLSLYYSFQTPDVILELLDP